MTATDKLKAILNHHNLSQSEAGRIAGVSKSTISLMLGGKYNGRPDAVDEVTAELEAAGYRLEEGRPKGSGFRVDSSVFIETDNAGRFRELCDRLLGPAGAIGANMAVVVGSSGLGKTETAKTYAARNEAAVYIHALRGMTETGLLREIAFQLVGNRPRTRDVCLTAIERETEGRRVIIFVDESDTLGPGLVDLLRQVNQIYGCPVVLIGELGLLNLVGEITRVKNRVRNKSLEFGRNSQADLAAFYQQALNLVLSPEATAALYRRCRGNFRELVDDAVEVANILNNSGLSEIDEAVIAALPPLKEG